MPRLILKDIPKDLYSALRERARTRQTSVAALVLEILRDQGPTAAERRARRLALRRLLKLQTSPSPGPGPYPSTEAMVREDRER